MSEIYHRNTLISNVNSKNKKEKKRKRNMILNFRVSLEEKRLIEERIALSGLKKQDFFIQSCMHQSIITYGNVRTFNEINNRIDVIEKILNSINRADELELEVLESLRMILEILNGLKYRDDLNKQKKLDFEKE